MWKVWDLAERKQHAPPIFHWAYAPVTINSANCKINLELGLLIFITTAFFQSETTPLTSDSRMALCSDLMFPRPGRSSDSVTSPSPANSSPSLSDTFPLQMNQICSLPLSSLFFLSFSPFNSLPAPLSRQPLTPDMILNEFTCLLKTI